MLTLDPWENRQLKFDLKELLALVSREGATLHWRVAANCEGLQTTFIRGATFRGANASTHDQVVCAAPNGLPLTWPEMVSLGDCTFQSIWGVYLGFADPEEPDLAAIFGEGWEFIGEGRSEFLARVPIALQAVDSTFWIVHARDHEVRARFESAYGPDTGRSDWITWRADERPSALPADPGGRIDAQSESPR